jgi:hypothetical protein
MYANLLAQLSADIDAAKFMRGVRPVLKALGAVPKGFDRYVKNSTPKCDTKLDMWVLTSCSKCASAAPHLIIQRLSDSDDEWLLDVTSGTPHITLMDTGSNNLDRRLVTHVFVSFALTCISSWGTASSAFFERNHRLADVLFPFVVAGSGMALSRPSATINSFKSGCDLDEAPAAVVQPERDALKKRRAEAMVDSVEAKRLRATLKAAEDQPMLAQNFVGDAHSRLTSLQRRCGEAIDAAGELTGIAPDSSFTEDAIDDLRDIQSRLSTVVLACLVSSYAPAETAVCQEVFDAFNARLHRANIDLDRYAQQVNDQRVEEDRARRRQREAEEEAERQAALRAEAARVQAAEEEAARVAAEAARVAAEAAEAARAAAEIEEAAVDVNFMELLKDFGPPDQLDRAIADACLAPAAPAAAPAAAAPAAADVPAADVPAADVPAVDVPAVAPAVAAAAAVPAADPSYLAVVRTALCALEDLAHFQPRLPPSANSVDDLELCHSRLKFQTECVREQVEDCYRGRNAMLWHGSITRQPEVSLEQLRELAARLAQQQQ